MLIFSLNITFRLNYIVYRKKLNFPKNWIAYLRGLHSYTYMYIYIISN